MCKCLPAAPTAGCSGTLVSVAMPCCAFTNVSLRALKTPSAARIVLIGKGFNGEPHPSLLTWIAVGVKRTEADESSLPVTVQTAAIGHPRCSGLCRAHRRAVNVWCLSLLQNAICSSFISDTHPAQLRQR
ncbi:hypothetical protein GOODEAATRI_007524 [Goodea atripinnis]|uniref:Secreted protein n=1 Tax=Goodea atripinnis TaxID=208336 RepID=A0ABV0P279_9TELE